MGWLSSLFGGGDEVETPTMQSSVQQWIDLLPQLMSASKEYAPQEAQLQYDILSQYAPQYANLQSQIRKQIYPETYGLQEQMAQMTSEGLSGDLTDAEKRMYLDTQRSLVGDQATSGIGSDYIGSNLLNYITNRQGQYQNLGTNLLNMMYGNANTSYSPSYTNFLNSNQSSLLNSAIQYPFNLEQYFPQISSGFNMGGALSGAVSGATTGTTMAGFPWGTIGGGVIGGLGGGFV